ncbi:hypothetical protein ACWD4V_01220 [Streptomyces tsukubensis]
MTTLTRASNPDPAQIAVALDWVDRPVVVLPDEVAARLSASSRTGVKNYGWGHFESVRFGADSYEAHAVRAMFRAVLTAHPDDPGLRQYERFGVGHIYGFIVGASGWDTGARTWRDYGTKRHLHVDPAHLHPDGRVHFGS